MSSSMYAPAWDSNYRPTFGIRRTFIWGDNDTIDSHGQIGWVMKDKSGFYPAIDGRTLAHDALEHCPSKHTNDRADECMAMGGYIRIRGMSYHQNFIEGLTTDLRGMLVDELQDEGMPLPLPPERITVLLHAYGEPEYLFRTAMKRAVEEVRENPYNHLDEGQMARIHAVAERMGYWVRLGYRRAVRRFRGAHPYRLSGLFNEVSAAADKILKRAEEGRLVLRIDPKTLEFQFDHEPWYIQAPQ